jgi:hypothetical protein
MFVPFLLVRGLPACEYKMYRWFLTGGRVVLPANASRVRSSFRASTQFVRDRERCQKDAHDCRQDERRYVKKDSNPLNQQCVDNAKLL